MLPDVESRDDPQVLRPDWVVTVALPLTGKNNSNSLCLSFLIFEIDNPCLFELLWELNGLIYVNLLEPCLAQSNAH